LVSPNEEFESAHVLPRPELNPLVNPLLADNMGRWAEVYFTAPADKREEAVLELLRELEAERAAGGAAAGERSSRQQPPVFSRPTPEYSSDSEHLAEFATEDPAIAHCETCDHDNPRSHQFCGMCGAKLGDRSASGSSGDDPVYEAPSRDGTAQHDHYSESRRSERPPNGSNGARLGLHHDIAGPERSVDETAFPESTINANDFSLFRDIGNGSPNDDSFDLTYERERSRRYRVYIGAVMAAIILALGYMAWKSGQTQSSHQVSAPPPVTADEPTASVNPPNAAPSNPAASNPAKVDEQPAQPPKAAETSPANAADNRVPQPPNVRATAASAKPAATEPTSGNPADQMAAGNGGEELAIAQRYLGGGNGAARNSTEAAQWLWKSVAKHNSSASLALADLYLKGDGVSKNCDQARVLLDSAARKGVSGAGERLRNLQAFGCQ